MAKTSIVFVESISTGAIRPARLSGEILGPEVYRQKVFHTFKDLEALDDQDLFDLAKEMDVKVTTKTDTAQLLWFQANRTQGIYLGPKEEGEVELARKPLTKKPRNAVRVSKNTRGRPSEFHGKKIYIKSEGNPRRAGTIGHKSFAIIKDGMLVEDFVAAGGRMVDLRWDVTAGNVEVR